MSTLLDITRTFVNCWLISNIANKLKVQNFSHGRHVITTRYILQYILKTISIYFFFNIYYHLWSEYLSIGDYNVAHTSQIQASSILLLPIAELFFLNSLLFASCTDTVKLLEPWRGVLSSTPPYK
jgi:hypothetical protein